MSKIAQRILSPFIEGASNAVARAIAGIRRDAQHERELRDAQFVARMLEFEARIAAVAELERKLGDRLASLKDGVPGRDGIDGGNGVDGRDGAPGAAGKDGAEGPAGRDGVDGGHGTAGRDVDPEVIRQAVAEAVAALPPAKDGKDGVDGAAGREGPPGKLPVARAWSDRVHYEGEVVTHGGGAWQAVKDTGREPPHADWICLAGAGRDGVDGRSLRIRSTWEAGAKDYLALDIVALNGASFIARRDDPGPCPGDGWQMVAGQGKQGKPGPQGDAGKAGPVVTAAVVAASISEQGLLVLSNADGTKVECDLYPVLARIA